MDKENHQEGCEFYQQPTDSEQPEENTLPNSNPDSDVADDTDVNSNPDNNNVTSSDADNTPTEPVCTCGTQDGAHTEGYSLYVAPEGVPVSPLNADTKPVAEVNGTKYDTLGDAVAAGGTVSLLDNVDISNSGLQIAAGNNVTLDLNGFNIKVANTTTGNIKVFGTLTLCDTQNSGKVYTETDYAGGSTGYPVICALQNGTFIMNGGHIETVRPDATNKGQFGVAGTKVVTSLLTMAKLKPAGMPSAGTVITKQSLPLLK